MAEAIRFEMSLRFRTTGEVSLHDRTVLQVVTDQDRTDAGATHGMDQVRELSRRRLIDDDVVEGLFSDPGPKSYLRQGGAHHLGFAHDLFHQSALLARQLFLKLLELVRDLGPATCGLASVVPQSRYRLAQSPERLVLGRPRLVFGRRQIELLGRLLLRGAQIALCRRQARVGGLHLLSGPLAIELTSIDQGCPDRLGGVLRFS